VSPSKTIPLSAVTTKIGSGATPTGGAEAYKQTGITLIRSLNVYDLVFQREGLAFIDDDQAYGLRNVIVEPDDVLLNITGASVARCCVVPRSILPARVNQHVAIVRTDKGKADPRFVCYCLVSPRYKDELLGIAQGGATREALTKEKIQDFQIPNVPLTTQRKIASILSAYDDLIENNTRRIAILEEMAQAIYREWFVNFRFPGHENVKLVESPLGKIPEGWEAKQLGNIADLRLGKMLDAKKNKGDLMPYLANVNVRWGEFDLQSLREMRFEADEREKYGLRFGDIVMCEGGEPGRCAIWTEQVPNMMIQKAIHRIRSLEEVDFRYLYFNLLYKGRTGHLESLFTGSTIKHLPGEKLKTVMVEVPTRILMNTFSELVEPMTAQVSAFTTRNENLCTTRDLLLPKLISGKLDVEDLDIDTGLTAEELEEATA
jgi:type I restriction enzyme, S subunit